MPVSDPSGAEVWWDQQIGTFMGQLGDLKVGNYAGEILTVSALEQALGVSLSADTGAQLGTAASASPYTANKRYVSKLQFMDLFRPGDLIKIYDAAKLSSAVQIQLDRVNRAPDDRIELTDPRVMTGLIQMEALGLLTAGDADRIQKGIPPS
jgi:hypothetical protein